MINSNLENIILEKVPHYFNGDFLGKNFKCYKDFYLYHYSLFSFVGLSFNKNKKPVIIISFLIPKYLEMERGKKIGKSGVSLYKDFYSVINHSVFVNLNRDNIFSKYINSYYKLHKEKEVLVSNVDYYYYNAGITLEKELTNEINLNNLKEILEKITNCTIKNLQSENPLRYLYI